MLPDLYIILLSGITIIALILISFFVRRKDELSNTNYIIPVIINALDQTIIITDSSSNILYTNQACEKLLKISQKEIIGKNISEIFANDQTRLTTELKKIDIKTKDGELIPVSLNVDEITDEEKKFSGYNITFQRKKPLQQPEKSNQLSDIDKLLEDLKKDKEKIEQDIKQKVLQSTLDIRDDYVRLRSAIDHLDFGFIMTDKEKNTILVNNVIKNMFPMPDSGTNINLQDLQKHTQSEINFLENADYILKNSKPLYFERITIDNNKYANIYISPVNSNSQTIGTVILIEDITEEKTAEKSKEDFFTIASHELRAPLTAIRGYIAIIKQLFFTNIKEEELKKIIQDIDTLSNRLIGIVNDFLDTPKLEQGKIKVKKETCDLIAITTASIKETNSIAAQKNLLIKFTNTLSSATVLGDRERIRQILINLISNGLKYTEQGEINIKIEKTPDSKYKISIKDTGKGIPKENIKFLFTKFQQTDPTKHMISTGLGLYISKLLAEKMNASIQLEDTQEGKGSTFSFSLPVYEQNTPANK